MTTEKRAKVAFADFFLPAPYFYAQQDSVAENEGMKTAAVLILLSDETSDLLESEKLGQSGWSVLLTVRSRMLRRHPGEVCFPGGMRDLQLDQTPVDTALRETYEEIGLPPSSVKVIGTLRPFMSLHLVRIFPVLALIEPIKKQQFRAYFSHGEVQTYFWAPLNRFLTDEGHQSFAVTGTDTLMHVFNFDEHMVFGITAALCVAVSIGLHGRLPAFPERIHNRILNKDENGSVDANLHAMFAQFGRLRGFIEPKRILDAMPSKL